MFYKPVDPASLSGEALDRWYRRTPDEIAAEKQAAAQRQYDNFFGPNLGDEHSSADDRNGVSIQLAAAATPSSAADWTCPVCHGRTPPTPSQFPVFPFGGTPPQGGSGRRGTRPHPPQCEMQLKNDTDICDRQPNKAAQSVCQGTAMKRYAHCISSDGELGEPELFTHPEGPRF